MEMCPSGNCDTVMNNVAKTSGYLLVCLSEPLIILGYSMRFLRIKRIFDAQKLYFDSGQRPSEMIKRYSEQRLAVMVIFGTLILTAGYMALGVGLWVQDEAHYGVLPTFAVQTDSAAS